MKFNDSSAPPEDQDGGEAPKLPIENEETK